MKKFIFTVFIIGFSVVTNAQYANKDGNRIGITLGVTQMSLTTNNFKTKPELGWVGGLAVRGNYYNDFSMIFGMQFTESNFTVETKPLISSKTEDVKYTLAGVQVRLLLSYNIVKDHVSLDFGPILQVNGKLRADSKYENNIISGTLLKTNDILDVTKFNGNLYAGISAGNKRIRAIVCYQYGMNNFLNNLNKKEELKIANNNSEFKGHLGILSGQLLFNL
jgi:Outer membrane protein beta-barrel domain